MPAKKPPTGTDADLNLATLSALFVDEDKARELIEAKLWPNGPICPHCDGQDVTKLTGRPGSKSPVRAGVYKCRPCRKQFTVRIGTIFEDSKLPICKWIMALHPRRSVSWRPRNHSTGTGCPVCMGGVGELEEALYALNAPPGSLRRGRPQAWSDQRAGSLAALNALAVGAGINLLIDYLGGSLRTSAWQRLRWIPGQGLRTDFAAAASDPGCQFCGQGRSTSTN